MTPDEYQTAMRRTAISRPVPPYMQRRMHFAAGLGSEAGEILGLLIKSAHYGKEYDVGEMKDELGDAVWYLTALCEECGYNLGDVMQRNIEKLQERHPTGFNHGHYQQPSHNRRMSKAGEFIGTGNGNGIVGINDDGDGG